MKNGFHEKLKQLSNTLAGELYFDSLYQSLYATDASIYRIKPLAVAFPKGEDDLKKLLAFAREHHTSIIPRTAGTSLAGQVVGHGIVVDVSKYLNQIVHIDTATQRAVVQPGVIRDDLNRALRSHGLFFAPNTSTSNRCMIGGMAGNNSSGTTSIKYGVTRDKVLEMEVLLADGSKAVFGEITVAEFFAKAKQPSLEGQIYRQLYQLLGDTTVQQRIVEQFPKPTIHRRNTGYAVDELLKSEVFSPDGTRFNLCKLLCGSEGTLAFTTQLTLQLDPVPPPLTAMVCAHFDSIKKCLQAVLPAMQYDLDTCEMMDKVVLDCTQQNPKYRSSRFFISGDPQAILMLEVKADSPALLDQKVQELLHTLHQTGLCYALPVLYGEDTEKALDLRKAGLGLLGNLVGDRKTIPCIEDTAVAVEDLAAYINDFSELMDHYGQQAVYYAHAGAGELHLRPILNIKKGAEVDLLYQITRDVAHLVKKYRGYLSGEHGDGIVRSSFIELMIGKENVELLRQIKQTFDPQGILNPGKIVDPWPMTQNLRYQPDRSEPEIETLLDFSKEQGILRAVEQCNGSGDCRKPEAYGGVMCPSYRVTQDEKYSTRGRANVLREFLTNGVQKNPFDHPEIKEAMALCVGCKGCQNECPSNVDIAAMKTEFLYQYRQIHGSQRRERWLVENYKWLQRAKRFPGIFNFFLTGKLTSPLIKKWLGIHPKRSLPKVSAHDFYKAYQKLTNQSRNYKKEVWFFVDEFIETTDTALGIDALQLLDKLGYKVLLTSHAPSGRAHISMGFLEEARQYAQHNVATFKDIINAERPLIGIEPSAILSFRDEYLRLVPDQKSAEQVAKNTFTIEEFLHREWELGNLSSEAFCNDHQEIKLHVHCHQKALSSITPTYNLLNIPKNFKVTIIPSGCCGMAGSFGYEQENYSVSMAMGRLSLFPAVEKAATTTIIVATGTSCRHQIEDATQRKAVHPVTILNQACLLV